MEPMTKIDQHGNLRQHTKKEVPSMIEHTPGPWKWKINYEKLDSGENVEIYDTEGITFIRCIDCDGQEEANARLIAAAPDLAYRLDELLATLSMCSDEFHANQARYGDILDSMDNAEKALYKARGKELTHE